MRSCRGLQACGAFSQESGHSSLVTDEPALLLEGFPTASD
jgi:hypothetical protein